MCNKERLNLPAYGRKYDNVFPFEHLKVSESFYIFHKEHPEPMNPSLEFLCDVVDQASKDTGLLFLVVTHWDLKCIEIVRAE